LTVRFIAANEQGLGAGGASTAARTGAKLANSHNCFCGHTPPLA